MRQRIDGAIDKNHKVAGSCTVTAELVTWEDVERLRRDTILKQVLVGETAILKPLRTSCRRYLTPTSQAVGRSASRFSRVIDPCRSSRLGSGAAADRPPAAPPAPVSGAHRTWP